MNTRNNKSIEKKHSNNNSNRNNTSNESHNDDSTDNELHSEAWPILKLGTEAFMDIVEQNLQGVIPEASDFEKIRIPTAGNLNWTIPTLSGGETVSEFEAIILHHQPTRSYWQKSINSGSTPPDCASKNGLTGTGDPGGDCTECSMAQFGSSPNSKGRQACKLTENLFVLLPESYLPMVLVLPPSSLKPFRQFIMQLSTANVPLQSVVVNFTLEKALSRSNIAYSLANFAVSQQLTEDETAIVELYSNTMKAQGSFDLQNLLNSEMNGKPRESEDVKRNNSNSNGNGNTNDNVNEYDANSDFLA